MALGPVSFPGSAGRLTYPNPFAEAPSDVKVNGNSVSWSLAGENRITLAADPGDGATIVAYPTSHESVSQDAQQHSQFLGAAVPEHRWTGTALSFRQNTGYWGASVDLSGGPIGPAGPPNSLAIGTVASGPAAAAITGAAPSQTLNLTLPPGTPGTPGLKGDKGDPNSLAIGTVTSGPAAATITGNAPSQTLNLTLPPGTPGTNGSPGPANSLAIGTVNTGAPGSPAAATITGNAPSQTLNLTIPRGAAGAGTGDMLTSTYDTNSDGVVDHAALADAAPWAGITNKPAFVPIATSGSASDLSTGTVPTARLPVIPSANLPAPTSSLIGGVKALALAAKQYLTSIGTDGTPTAAQPKTSDLSDAGQANGAATLDATGKVPSSQLPSSVVGDVQYQGLWDASANSPAIPAASSANKGQYYVVGTAGTSTIPSGGSKWNVGDWLVSNGSTGWDRISNTDMVTSVNGRQGAVTTAAADITDGGATGRSLLQAANAIIATAILSAFGGDSGSGGVKGLVPAPSAGDAAAGKFLSAAGGFAVPAGAYSVPVRQTVLGGPSASGAPSFLPATTAALTLTTQNIAGASPLVLSNAIGFSSGGAANNVYQFTANFSWPAATASAGQVFFAIDGVTGARSILTLAPIYQFGGAPATTNGQFTFDYCAMQGWMGNGSAAVASNLVVVGEGTVGASTITGIVAYAYLGYYESPWVAGLPTGGVNANHNIGTMPLLRRFIAECTTADIGYSVGDQIATDSGLAGNASSFVVPTGVVGSRLVAALIAGSSGANPWQFANKSTWASTNPTLSSWRRKFQCARGW